MWLGAILLLFALFPLVILRDWIMKSAFVGSVVVISFLVSVPTEAQTFTVLHNFNSVDGGGPMSDLTLRGSTLFGMTSNGGANGCGTVFSIPANGGTLTTLGNFDASYANHRSNLTLSDSTFYGMTDQGGTYGKGSLFSIPLSGGSPTTLYSFDGTHGSYPEGGLTLNGSTLYGMSSAGGTNNQGTIFSVPTNGGTPITLYNFDGTHGGSPNGNLTLNGSTIYGMTSGGGTNLRGTIFSFPVSGGTPDTLFNFGGTNGKYPQGSLTLSSDGSTLYGMTREGGTNDQGTIFSIPLSGGTPTTLFNFDGTHGRYAIGSLTLSSDGSTLYGMTVFGGTSDKGTIFSIPVSGGIPTVLFNFDGTRGRNPMGSLTLSGSTLYGMTLGGGTVNAGTVFSLTVPEPSTLALLFSPFAAIAACSVRRKPRRPA